MKLELRQAAWCALFAGMFAAMAIPCGYAQGNSYERTFPQSKAAVENALKNLQVSMAGRLPTLDGFAKPGQHSLDRYQRGYYQASVQVSPAAGGGSLVRVSMKVTAWYNDPVAAHSEYQLLTSNGRLEADLLDQLADQLASAPAPHGSTSTTASADSGSSSRTSAGRSEPAKSEPAISAPAPQFPQTDQTFSTSLSHGLAEEGLAANGLAKNGAAAGSGNGGKAEQPNVTKTASALQAETESLQEILKNLAHPKNLVAVKRSGTPVVGSPSLTAKPLFLASLHDEFELLNFNADWVHVRISGLSRGWIWRNSVEMPEGIPDTEAAPAVALAAAADLFHVTREETAPFPGDWEPLRGKNVKIVSVQKIDDAAKDAGPKERLEFAKFMLDKSYSELAQKPADLAGIVVIFDSADGGMIAATMPTLEQWRAGRLSDSALWHKSFFDPPETFDSAGTPASP
jgi:hypothetical protein